MDNLAFLGALVTVAVAFLTLLGVLIKLLLSQFSRRIDTKLESIERAQQAERAGVEKLQQKVDGLTATLPLEYVRREDWIRFSAGIDAKLDRLAELLHRHRGEFR